MDAIKCQCGAVNTISNRKCDFCGQALKPTHNIQSQFGTVRRRKNRTTLVKVLKIYFVILGGIVVIVLIAGEFRRRSTIEKMKSFEPDLPEYRSIASQTIGGPSYRDDGPPHIKGKVIVLDHASRIEGLTFALGDLTPRIPADVGTVINIACDPVVRGYYSNGRTGYAIACSVELWDRSNGANIGSGFFSGSDPPSTIGDSEDHTGAPPDMIQIKRYILSLPHKDVN